MKFSIIVVCLNAGTGLEKTMDSIFVQTNKDFEVILKDGGSKDGCVDHIEQRFAKEIASGQIKIIKQKDRGIYDAMNQALAYAGGEYFLFLNCGDYLYEKEVLQKVQSQMTGKKQIYYGNLYQRALDATVYAYKEITPFTCYRNVPCHQTCFYHRELFQKRGYDPKYVVRADYEHFLYCYFTKKAQMQYMDLIVCSYEGGGFSETKEHLSLSKKEHYEITHKYMKKSQLFRYKMFMMLTLQPLRSFIANNKKFSGIYNGIKCMIYKGKR